MQPTRKPPLLLAVLLAMVLAITGCAGESSPSAEHGEATFPLHVTGANGEIEIPREPERIISLSPTATESLFAIGAGRRVIAVDDQSDFPANAPKTDLSGFTPNAEAIAGHRPDFVVVSNDLNGIVDALERLDVPVLVQAAATTLDDVYGQIETLGRITGQTEGAHDLVEDMRKQIDDAVQEHRVDGPARSYYHEVDNTLFSVTSETFVGRIYSLFNLRNIADAADTTGSGYPQLSAEYIVTARPDFIFLADSKCCAQNFETVSNRPGWSNIPAVQNERVVELDDDIASRWGPRTVDLVRAIGDAVEAPAA